MIDEREPTGLDIRLHALNIAAATYREVFRIARNNEELPDLAEQVLADARKYAQWVGCGDTAPSRSPSTESETP